MAAAGYVPMKCPPVNGAIPDNCEELAPEPQVRVCDRNLSILSRHKCIYDLRRYPLTRRKDCIVRVTDAPPITTNHTLWQTEMVKNFMLITFCIIPTLATVVGSILKCYYPINNPDEQLIKVGPASLILTSLSLKKIAT